MLKREEKEVFTSIYDRNSWRNKESKSGSGSTLGSTKKIREWIPIIFQKYNFVSVVDLACGDFNWMSTVDLSNYQYLGLDIVDDVIASNIRKYNKDNINFKVGNIIKDDIPFADVAMTIACFIHFPAPAINDALGNIRKSGIKYLISSCYIPKYDNNNINKNISFGDFRPVNLSMHPFNLKAPIELLVNKESVKNKLCIGLYEL